jgi:hypothetical protein
VNIAKNRYGLLTYNATDNLGDEIQSIAVRQFLPQIDYYVDRDSMTTVAADGSGSLADQEFKMILNGWFIRSDRMLNWPPPKNITPLIASIHITPETADMLLQPAGEDFFRAHSPIGCRDRYTLGLFRQRNIESYFSACATLTLNRPDIARDDNLIVACDVPDEVLRWLTINSEKNIGVVSPVGYRPQDTATRFTRASWLLDKYARASCVVTSRLHCVLPCIAMGTPVLMISKTQSEGRFFGLETFFNSCTKDELVSGGYSWDPDAPPQNANSHLPYRERLIAQFTKFVAEA